MRPLLGWISAAPARTGSVGAIRSATAASAEAWAAGSMSVLMVSPPRLSRFSRSSVVPPILGIWSLSSVRRT